jgi:AmmeMemoRadiSam system protein A/AmmeMemoRadiSam system protein B
VGDGRENDALKTLNAMKRAAGEIKKERPSTIILTTPHGPVFQDFIYISTSKRLNGSLGKFGASGVRLEFTNNIELTDRIIEASEKAAIPAGGLDESLIRKYRVSKELDHGAMVPLYFINREYSSFKLVHIAIAGLSFIELYRFGMCIAEAVRESDERVVFAASGDLSHRLTQDAPYGYNPDGRKYDELIVRLMGEADIESMLEIKEELCENAGECGLRSFIMMLGALDGYSLKPEVYSYEGPFGVGYSVARFDIAEKTSERLVYDRISQKNSQMIKKIRSSEDPYVELARQSLEIYIREKRVARVPDYLPEDMIKNAAGVFVSIKKHGQLRGCIGTTGPTRKNIAEEIIFNAISSGTRDPRFSSVEEEELDSLVYSVDVLKEPESIRSIDELDVVGYGVIVRAGSRSGLLLPNLEGVDTPEKQVSIALQKAGINPEEKYRMERFEVIRHK